ncbi:DUF1007 family protein [Lutibaculum baratangense]|uniref:EF-hand domain-containing protein n=1 Tax=Lutibaculum baratangense AMV1 TaxID=631454 RepID=V4TF51_9HYPH|nr:DUF1007 family protein [Lutibaculum baratangense]ESR24808.1 protein of unknown function DUF1007 [Lutibaculum baratangense AMV1]
MRRLLWGLTITGAALAAQEARAHPHVWVTTQSELVFKNGVLAAVRHEWTFDEYFSAYAAQGLDANGDGVLSREELEPLAKVNVESLSDFEFFTFLKVGEYPAAFQEPQDYWLEEKGDQLVLHFTLPIEKPMLVGDRRTSLEIYDPTFFVDFTLAETESVVMAGAPDGCRLDIERASGFAPGIAARLAELPVDMRDIPDDLFEMTSGNANRALVTCN